MDGEVRKEVAKIYSKFQIGIHIRIWMDEYGLPGQEIKYQTSIEYGLDTDVPCSVEENS